MRTTARRTATVVAASAVAALLAVPLAGAAQASGSSNPFHSVPTTRVNAGAHGWHGSLNPATRAARATLRTSLAAADNAYRTSVRAARAVFRADPVVIAAKAAYDTAVDAAQAVLDASGHTEADYLAYRTAVTDAKAAFDTATATQATTRDDAIALAKTTWLTARDAAYTVYETATLSPVEAGAAKAFRDSVTTARLDYRAAIKSANATFKTDTAGPRATRAAALAAARWTFQHSAKDQAAIDAYEAAVKSARTAYDNDATVIAATTARNLARSTARTTYTNALEAARAAFFVTTGHNPLRPKHLLPRV